MLNRIVLMGRITHDLEMKTTQSGVSAITFSIACDEDYKPKDGGDRDVDFIRVKAWRHTAEFVNTYFSKGRSIIVSGRLKADNYTDKDGNKRTDTYVLADTVYFGDSKRDGGDSITTSTSGGAVVAYTGFADLSDIPESDLPF